MKRIIALLLAALMLIGLAACGDEKTGAEETLPETTSENPNSAAEAEGIRALSFDWEAEKEKDEIFAWEDPYPNKEWNEIDGLSEEEAFDLLRMRNARALAERNYKAYYYFLSGRSECDYSRGEKNSEYESPIVYVGTAVYPDDVIKLTLVEYVVKFRVKGLETTVEKRTGDEAVVEKDVAMGEGEQIEYTHLLCEITDCLKGDWKGKTDFSLTTSLLSTAFVEALKASDGEWIAYINPVMTDYEAGTRKTVELSVGELEEYSLSADACFALKDGKLQSYSSVNDILAFDGKTPEELMTHVKMLREKYGTEMLEALRPGDLVFDVA